jgi:hypothetical protein
VCVQRSSDELLSPYTNSLVQASGRGMSPVQTDLLTNEAKKVSNQSKRTVHVIISERNNVISEAQAFAFRNVFAVQINCKAKTDSSFLCVHCRVTAALGIYFKYQHQHVYVIISVSCALFSSQYTVQVLV